MAFQANVDGRTEPAATLYSLEQVRGALGCGRKQVYDLIRDGKLSAVRLGKRTMITAESFAALPGKLGPITIQPEPRHLVEKRKGA